MWVNLGEYRWWLPEKFTAGIGARVVDNPATPLNDVIVLCVQGTQHPDAEFVSWTWVPVRAFAFMDEAQYVLKEVLERRMTVDEAVSFEVPPSLQERYEESRRRHRMLHSPMDVTSAAEIMATYAGQRNATQNVDLDRVREAVKDNLPPLGGANDAR